MSWLDDSKANRQMLLERLENNTVIPFIGAGMSRPIYPSWEEYLNMLVDPDDTKASETVDKMLRQTPCNYEDVIQYIQKRSGVMFFRRTQEIFSYQKIVPEQMNEAASAIPQLSCGPIITTNLDQSVEWLYQNQEGIRLPVGRANDRQFISTHMASAQPCLWKIHGDINIIESWVLCADDYQKLYGNNNDSQFLEFFHVFLQNRTLLFLGASLRSDKIVQLLQNLFAENHSICHFAVLPLSKQMMEAKSPEYFDERSRLNNMGILPLWYPEGDYAAFSELVWSLVKKNRAGGKRIIPLKIPRTVS